MGQPSIGLRVEVDELLDAGSGAVPVETCGVAEDQGKGLIGVEHTVYAAGDQKLNFRGGEGEDGNEGGF